MKEGHQKNYKNLERMNLMKVCGFEVESNDTAKEKIEEQLDKGTKAKQTQQKDSRTRFRKNFANLEKKTN